MQVIGCQIDRTGKKGFEHGVGAARHPAHFLAELALRQIHAQAGAHQAQANNGNATVGKMFGHGFFSDF